MRYFLSILAVIFIVVVIIVLIAKGGGTGKPAIAPPNLLNYNNSGDSVSQIVTGTLTGEDRRQAIEITISQDSRNIYVLNGYEQNISNSETFSNTPAAYTVFLQGIQALNYTKSRKFTGDTTMFAACPLGDTFQYILNSPTKTVTSLWSTSCALSQGTFDGQGSTIRSLFQLQIPNFATFTQNLQSIPNDYGESGL